MVTKKNKPLIDTQKDEEKVCIALQENYQITEDDSRRIKEWKNSQKP